MKTRRLLSAFLALIMVVSMVAFPVAAETISTADGSLVGSIYAPAEKWTANPHTDVNLAVDGDESTYWSCSGQNYYTAKTQYYGYYYAGGAVIDSITFKVSGYTAYDAETATYGGIRAEVSTDGSNWTTIWEDATTGSSNNVVTLNADNWDTAVMTEDAVWNYVRVAYGNEDGYCNWDMLNVFEFAVTGEYVVPADAIVDFYKIENPLSTTFGTRANLLENAYVMQNDGRNGIGLILKVEGIADGETAFIEGIEPVISRTVEVSTPVVDEAGNEVLDSDGNPTYETTTETKTYSLGWHGNWVWGSCNMYTFSSDGYYMYYVPFNALENNLSMTSVAGDTTISALNVFRTDYSFNPDNGKVSTVDDGISISLVGICENAAPAGSAFVKDADGTTLLGLGSTSVALDTSWTSGSYAWWNKITTVDDIYAGNGAAPYGSVIDHYVDANGTEYAIDDYILGTVNLTAVYGERDIVKYTASVSELTAGEEATVTVKVDDAALASAGKVTVAYNANAFTCENNVIEYTEIAEDGTIGSITVKLNKLASSGDYTFALTAEATSDKGDVIAEYENATVTFTSSQPAGIYFENSDVVALGDGSSEVNIWEGDHKFSGAIAGMTFVYKLDGIETPIDPGCLDTNFYYSDTASKNLSYSNWFYNNQWSGGYVRDHMSYEQNGVYYTYLNMRITNNSGDYFYGVKDFAIFHVYDSATTISNENANATAQMLAIVENNLAPTATFYDAEGNVIATQTNQYTYGATEKNWEGSTAKCYGTGLVLTPDELFAASGVAEPTKADNEDGTPNLFNGWVDADGNPVEAVYYNVDLYPSFTSDYVAYDATVSVNGDEVTLIITTDGTAVDRLDAGTINVAIDENVFESSLAVDGVISVDFDLTPATEDDTTEEGTTEEGTTEDEVATAAEVTDILATIVLNIKSPVATGDYDVAISGTAADAEGADIFVKENTATVSVVGQDVTGAFLDEEKVVINSAEEGTAPAEQTVWTGNVDLGGADIATFIFKIEGAETEMDVTQYAPIVNGTAVIGQYGNTWLWDNHWGHDNDADGDGIYEDGFAAGMKIAGDGTYYVSLARRYIANDGSTKYNTVNGFKLFQTPNTMSSDVALVNYSATNTNEAATFQMLAIFADDLTPTVNFYDEDKTTLVGTYEYEYSALTGYADGQYANRKMKSFGTLASAADVFAASGLTTPTKASDENYVYIFAGWVDAEGNPVTDIYYDQDVYASYTASPKDTKYVVTFVSEGETYATAEVYENDVPTAPETAPTKADSATGTYTFAGWALTEDGEVVDLGTVKITEDTTLYAVYTYADVTFTVTYYNGTSKMYTETVIRSQAAVYDGIPTKATDKYVEGADGYYYTFSQWEIASTDDEGNDIMVKADLTNIQADTVVYAAFDATLVENWWTVTWVDTDGTTLATATVADGEGTSTSAKGALNGTATETVWYTFSGWDTDTTAVTSDLTVTIVYTETAVATGANTVIAEGSGTVGTQNDLVTSDAPYTYTTTDNGYMTLIFDIKGASEENPITIGGIRTDLVNGGTQINSNASANYSQTTAAIRGVTADGKYYMTYGVYILTWVGGGVFETVKYLSIDDANSTRGGVSSGEGTYDVTVIEGKLEPTVRFYDEDGNWLYTGKYTYNANLWAYTFNNVPTVDAIYKGAELENFEAWVDADGNVVTEVTENMDVYAKIAHTHDWVAQGQGYAVCECGESIENAFTIVAAPVCFADIKAGDEITVPVMLDNGALTGVTFDVTVTGDATVSGIRTEGAAFDGFTAEYADGRVVLNAATGGADIDPEEGTPIVTLVLVANKDMTAEDVVTVKVDLVQAVNIANEDITANVYSGCVAEMTFEVTASDVLWGDVDGSGAIDGTDTMLLSRYTSGWGEDDYADAIDLMTAGDVDGSGVIDGTDTMLLSRYTSGWGESDYADAVNLLAALATLG